MVFKYAFLSLLLTPLLVVFVPVYEIMHRFGLFDIDRGQRVMICGASSGIGEQIAYQYARKGAHLALIARRQHELSIVAKNALDLGEERKEVTQNVKWLMPCIWLASMLKMCI